MEKVKGDKSSANYKVKLTGFSQYKILLGREAGDPSKGPEEERRMFKGLYLGKGNPINERLKEKA